MKSALHKLLIVCCALSLTGAHWVVLQTYAWAAMVVERSSEVGISQAVESTFSGEKPCQRCRAIAAGKKEEQQPASAPALKSLKEVEFVSAAGAILPSPKLVGVWFPMEFVSLLEQRAEVPLLPPPRLS